MPLKESTAYLDATETTDTPTVQKTLRREEDAEGRLVGGYGLLNPQAGVSGTPLNYFVYVEPDYPAAPPPSTLTATDFDDDDSSSAKAQTFLETNGHIAVAYAAAFLGNKSRRLLLSRPASPTDLSWDNDVQRKQWSAQLFTSISQAKAQLDTVDAAGKTPGNKFLAGYDHLTPQLQLKFWAELLIGVAYYESGWDPQNKYQESDGTWSIGLFQLSYEDADNGNPYQLEPLDPAAKSLEDPYVNIRCGVKIFSHLVARYQTVATNIDGNVTGAAEYWSTLRYGHKFNQIQYRTKTNTPV